MVDGGWTTLLSKPLHITQIHRLPAPARSSINHPPSTPSAGYFKMNLYLRPYDTGKAKRYEVPAEWTEEVSLTSLTDRSKSKKKNS